MAQNEYRVKEAGTMSEYIGEVGKRITITAKLVNDYTYTSH